MKGIKFIIACILSLTIVYVGGGTNLSYCRCANNMVAKSGTICKCHSCELNGKAERRECCMHKAGKQHGKCSSHGRMHCCGSIVYKVDLQKDTSFTSFDSPVCALLSECFLPIHYDLPTKILNVSSISDPPGPYSSRFYLNLYSTLLI